MHRWLRGFCWSDDRKHPAIRAPIVGQLLLFVGGCLLVLGLAQWMRAPITTARTRSAKAPGMTQRRDCGFIARSRRAHRTRARLTIGSRDPSWRAARGGTPAPAPPPR